MRPIKIVDGATVTMAVLKSGRVAISISVADLGGRSINDQINYQDELSLACLDFITEKIHKGLRDKSLIKCEPIPVSVVSERFAELMTYHVLSQARKHD